jgi:hypothetical protein
MKQCAFWVGVLALASLPAVAHCETRLSGTEICSCLDATPLDNSGKRDGAWGVSFLVPGESQRTHRGDRQMEAMSWLDAATGTRVALYSPWYFHELVPLPGEECERKVSGKRIFMVGRSGRGTVSLSFHMGVDKLTATEFLVTATASSTQRACATAARVFRSATFGPEGLAGIRIVSIAADHRSFRYETYPGTTITARIHDNLVNDLAKVVAISAKTVTIDAIEPDGTGGWMEVHHALPLSIQQQ